MTTFWNPRCVPPMKNHLINEVASMASNTDMKSLAQSYGLDITTVSWEDTARSKGSCWGPNITDMTLAVESYEDSGSVNMPVIRKPNLADLTADQPIEKFSVVVGNESGSEQKKQISFSEYLENIQTYTDNNLIKKLLVDRDTVLLTSTQACILPLKDDTVEFCVNMYNYKSQSNSDDPAVLVIMSTSEGTSTQVVYGTTSLYFNNNGTAYNLKAKRLGDDRKEREAKGETIVKGASLTEDEQNKNVIFIYQIPLKQKKPVRERGYFCKSMACFSAHSCVLTSVPKRGLDKAIISLGSIKGSFSGTKHLELERDVNYPIRCTVQYYNVTDTATVTEAQMKEFSETLSKVYTSATASGSLVFNKTDRKTEPVLSPAATFTTTRPLGSFL